MKSTKLTPLLLTVVLAIAGFAVLHFSHNDSALMFALGIIIGGVATSLLPSANGGASESNDKQTLYVGNLPYKANETIVRELFEKHGPVFSVRLVKDKQTGRRRGFGFVAMTSAGAQSAMKALNDTEFQQRVLKVREAKDKTSDDSQATNQASS